MNNIISVSVNIVMLAICLYYIKMSGEILIKAYFMSKPRTPSTADTQTFTPTVQIISYAQQQISKLISRRTLKDIKPPSDIMFKR